MNFEETYEAVKHLQDGFSVSEKHCFDLWCLASTGRSLIVELGSHRGFSTAFLGMSLKYTKSAGKVISVDNSLHIPENHRSALFKSLGLDNITCVNQSSLPYLTGLLVDGVHPDIIFHDASHGNEVANEYLLAYAALDNGGYLVIHDYEQLSFPLHERVPLTEFWETKDEKGRSLAVLYKQLE